MKRTLTVAAALSVLLLPVTPYRGATAAQDPASLPTLVSSLSGTDQGGSLAVTGTATFGGERPVVVGTDAKGDPPAAPHTARLGVDLIDVSIHRPDPSKPEVQFVWKVAALDATPPPEVIRYLWQMKINDKEYWLQAKTTDFLSGTNVADDPAGHAQHLQGAFKLRGNCGPIVGEVPNVTTCKHVAWLTGTFDTANDEIRVQVPLDLAAAPDFRPGATVTPSGVAEAGFQAAVSNPTTADQVTPDTPYTIAARTVRLGVAPIGTDPSKVAFSTPATLAENDTFTGTLSTAGLAPGTYDVFARACFGTNCGIRSLTGVTVPGPDGTVAVLRLHDDPGAPDQSFAFWAGGNVRDKVHHSLPLVGDPAVSNCATSPCFRYFVKVATPGALRLRIAIDTPTRNDNFFTQVTPPSGQAVSMRNSNAFNGEIFIDNPSVGTYEILVRPYSAENTTFAMRAKLEDRIPTRQPDADGFLPPDLRPTAPYELGFIAPANPANGVFPPDDLNPPADVAGVHPISCAVDETADDGVVKCLRFSFGLTNHGPGNFDIRWTRTGSDVAASGPMTQCVQRADGTSVPRPAGRYAFHPTHFHTHYEDIIHLQLYRVTDPDAGTMVEAGDGRKLGYSPADQGFSDWYAFDQPEPGTSGSAGNCAPGTNNRLGMSVGWGDVYRYQRPGNFVDFADNPDGRYVVQLTVDPLDNVFEADETNNVSYTYVRVTGDVIEVLEHGRGTSPWDPGKQVLRPRFQGGVPW